MQSFYTIFGNPQARATKHNFFDAIEQKSRHFDCVSS